MKVVIMPGLLRGSVTPPPSKSLAHRLILCAALAEGTSRLRCMTVSQDIEATLRCIQALGAAWQWDGSMLVVQGISGTHFRTESPLPCFDCGESGSTLRFMLPVALAVAGGGTFTGRGRLMERPQEPYKTLFQEKGIVWQQRDGVLTVTGRLKPGRYALPGNVSSQFFTGLLYALPLLDGASSLVPTTLLESESYIGLTLQALEMAGVRIASTRSLPPQYIIPGGWPYRPISASVEADWSQAAFWYAARALGCPVKIEGINEDSFQGDRAILSYCDMLASPGDVEIPLFGYPDLAPPLAAVAAVRKGTTRLTGAGRLRLKESDRLMAITRTLNALGAQVEEHTDSLVIRGVDALAGGCTVDCWDDHRIAMMLAVAAVRCREPVTLLGAECVVKSYPGFWEEYRALGGMIDEYAGE